MKRTVFADLSSLGLIATLSQYASATDTAFRKMSRPMKTSDEYIRRHVVLNGSFMALHNGAPETDGVGGVWPKHGFDYAGSTELTIQPMSDDSVYLCVHPKQKNLYRVEHAREVISVDCVKSYNDCCVLVFRAGEKTRCHVCDAEKVVDLLANDIVVTLFKVALDPVTVTGADVGE